MPYPDDQNLTQLATLKAWAQIPDNNADATLTALIGRVSGAIKVYMSAPVLISGAVSEIRNGKGSFRMMLTARPIISVQSVIVDTLAIPAAVNSLGAGWLVDKSSVYLVGGYSFTEGFQNVDFEYTAGYTSGSAEQASLEQAALETCGEWWKAREKGDKLSQSASGGGQTAWGDRSLPLKARMILDQIRRKVPIQ